MMRGSDLIRKKRKSPKFDTDKDKKTDGLVLMGSQLIFTFTTADITLAFLTDH